MTIEQIRKRWEQIKNMQPSPPEEDPHEQQMTMLNFSAEHFDSLLVEIERMRLRIMHFGCNFHRTGCPNGWWVTPRTCSCGWQVAKAEDE